MRPRLQSVDFGVAEENLNPCPAGPRVLHNRRVFVPDFLEGRIYARPLPGGSCKHAEADPRRRHVSDLWIIIRCELIAWVLIDGSRKALGFMAAYRFFPKLRGGFGALFWSPQSCPCVSCSRRPRTLRRGGSNFRRGASRLSSDGIETRRVAGPNVNRARHEKFIAARTWTAFLRNDPFQLLGTRRLFGILQRSISPLVCRRTRKIWVRVMSVFSRNLLQVRPCISLGVVIRRAAQKSAAPDSVPGPVSLRPLIIWFELEVDEEHKSNLGPADEMERGEIVHGFSSFSRSLCLEALAHASALTDLCGGMPPHSLARSGSCLFCGK